MAVFNGDRLIYKTLVATGRPGVGDKDYSTVKGVFSALGNYRPASQTMQGGSRVSDSYYSIDDIRYITYFYQDYAIHGSYWHAKYGIGPRATVVSTQWSMTPAWSGGYRPAPWWMFSDGCYGNFPQQILS